MAMLAKTAYPPLFADSTVDPVHDILIPELATVQASLELIRNEIDSLRTGIRLRDESHTRALTLLSEKLDRILDLTSNPK